MADPHLPPQYSHTSDMTPLQAFKRSAPMPAPASIPPQRPSESSHEDAIDYRTLLLSLADQYIDEARSMAAHIAHNGSEVEANQYCKLMTTAFCCYEKVLSQPWLNTKPRDEALVRLRYATCLFEDTENDHEAENILSKGISLCEKNRLLDLKYSMQHLVTRILFKTKQKAAFKFLDNIISDAATSEHTVWVYALRFLRISLSLQIGTAHELQNVLSQVNSIQELARRSRDKSIAIMASIIEACVHLRIHNLDSIENVQQSLASCHANLMSLSDPPLAQMRILTSMTDLACSLDPHDTDASKKKMKDMQTLLDTALGEADLESECGSRQPDFNADGSFGIPLERSKGGTLITDTGGIFSHDTDGREYVRFAWLLKKDTYGLGFLLCAAALYPQNATKNMLKNIRVLTNDEFSFANTNQSDSLYEAHGRLASRRLMRCHGLLLDTLMKLDSSAWKEASQALLKFEAAIETLGSHRPAHLDQLRTYLRGVVAQSEGDFDTALHHYASPELSIPAPQDRAATHVQTQLAVLAALNTLVMTRQSDHLSTDPHLSEVLTKLSAHFPNNTHTSNSHLTSAYSLIKAIHSTSILDRKSHLKITIELSRKTNNQQLLLLCMHYLYDSMCRGIMGGRSINTAKAALLKATDANNKTWLCVANGVMADAFELEGNMAQAKVCRKEAAKYFADLPGALGLAENEFEDGEKMCD